MFTALKAPFTLLLLAVVLVACGQLAEQSVSEQAIITSPNDNRSYRSLVLENGLEVLLIADENLESAGASLNVGVGSYHNPPALPGLAHYLEHMLFLGTENFPEPNSFQQFVEKNAGFSNAYTASDHTNYYFQVSNSVLDEALLRFSDYFKSPTFDEVYSDKERHAVDSEWSMGRTQDGRIINRLRGLTASDKHPSQQISVGNLQTLVDQPDQPLYQSMREFYDRYYSANLMKLVIFGKSDLDTLQVQAEKHFSGIANKKTDRPQVSVRGLTEDELAKHIYYVPQKPMRRLHLEFAIDDNSDQWRVKPNDYLANLISSEEPGTVAEVLRKKGWVDDFTAVAHPDYYGKDGFFTIQIGLTPEGLEKTDEIIAAVFAYIELIKEQGVDEVYYREFQSMLEKRFADMQMPNPLHQAIHYSATLFDLPAANIINAPYVYERFDREAILQVLEQLSPERVRVWHMHSEAPAEQKIPWYEGRFGVENIGAEERWRWQQLSGGFTLALPEENDLFTTDKTEEITPKYMTPVPVAESEGLEAWLSHSQYHPSEQGYIQIQFNSDIAQQSAKNWVLSDLLNRVFALNTMALRDKAGRAGISIGIERPKDNHALTLTGYTEKHPLLYKRLLEQWLKIDINELAFSTVTDGFSQWLEGQKKQEPYRQLFAELNRLMKDAAWTEEALRDALNSITREDLQAYHRELMSANRIRIFAFGNYSEQTVQEIATLTRRTLADIRTPRARYTEQYRRPVVGEELKYAGTTEQSDNALLLGWYSPAPELKVGATLALLNANFHNAFYTQLRTHEQLGYVVGSSYDRIGDYWGFIVYAQSTHTGIDGLRDRFDAFMQEYWPQLQNLDEAELAQLKAALIAQILQPPDNLYDEYPRFINDFYRSNDSFDTRDRLIEAIRNVSGEDIITLYRRLVLEGEAQQVEVVIEGSG